MNAGFVCSGCGVLIISAAVLIQHVFVVLM